MSAKRYLTEREQPQQARVGDTYVSKGTTSRDEAVPVSREAAGDDGPVWVNTGPMWNDAGSG